MVNEIVREICIEVLLKNSGYVFAAVEEVVRDLRCGANRLEIVIHIPFDIENLLRNFCDSASVHMGVLCNQVEQLQYVGKGFYCSIVVLGMQLINDTFTYVVKFCPVIWQHRQTICRALREDLRQTAFSKKIKDLGIKVDYISVVGAILLHSGSMHAAGGEYDNVITGGQVLALVCNVGNVAADIDDHLIVSVAMKYVRKSLTIVHCCAMGENQMLPDIVVLPAVPVLMSLDSRSGAGIRQIVRIYMIAKVIFHIFSLHVTKRKIIYHTYILFFDLYML